MTRIKLCGMTRPEDIDAVNELRPDYAGFILSAGFRRSITEERFAELYNRLDRSIKCAGVFVNEPIERAAEIAAAGLDIIQLHGSEDEDYIRLLKRSAGKPIIKAFTVRSAEDIAAARRCSADHILLDSGTGTGRAFDHSLIRNIGRPFFLAGGLTAENVAEVIESFKPYGVDASSSLETDGVKDRIKMAAFVRAVRGKEDHYE